MLRRLEPETLGVFGDEGAFVAGAAVFSDGEAWLCTDVDEVELDVDEDVVPDVRPAPARALVIPVR